ncbi:MAG: peptidoglycan-binding protein [Oscillospiraceae bacterium]|nr:peptidoglycan-binding protein [Oscillospiraceae bacterium]
MFKSLKIILFIAILAIIPLFGAAVSHADYTRVSESVNLREKPSTDSKVLKLVPMGYEVSVQSASDGWTKVVFDGTTGYVRSDFLEVVRGESSSGAGGASQSSSTATVSSGSGAAQSSGGSAGASDGSGSSSSGALRYGDEGEDVRELQKLLTEKGFYDGPINGKFGPLTENAVMQYQEEMGLDVDGVVGSGTMNKLTEKPRPAGTYRFGDEGEGVKNVQTKLKEKGFYTGPVNSKFGPLTEEAVRKFQGANGLEVDGIVGRATLNLLNAPTKSLDKPASTTQNQDDVKSAGTAPNGVELIDWSVVKKVFSIGVPARVYDVRSGKVYYVKAFSNGNHADVEPVTVEDTATLKSTFGGVWSWTPRPVWVTVNGRTFAGSINGMPHGGGVNNSNGMDGQVCLHFRGSATHNGNTAYGQQHQNAIVEAWNAASR